MTCGGASLRSPWASHTRSAGTRRGAVTLLRRGADRIRPYGASEASPAQGVDVARAVKETQRLAERIERRGLVGLPPSDLRPRLLA